MASNYDNTHSSESSLDHYLKQIATCGVLTREEEISAFNRMKSGDKQSLEQLVRSNLKLVIKIAFKYRNRGMMMHDLIEEGNVGLLEAIKRFDVKKGFRFSTYATWWIRQSIEKSIMDQTRTIRLPTHIIRELSRILKVSDSLVQKHFSTNISTDELAEKLGVEKNRIDEVIRHRYDVMSLDQLLYEDSRTTKEMMLEDGQNHFKGIEDKSSIDRMKEGLELLSRVDRRIIRLRYGLDGRKPRAVTNIAQQMNLSRDYIHKSILRSQAVIADYINNDSDTEDNTAVGGNGHCYARSYRVKK